MLLIPHSPLSPIFIQCTSPLPSPSSSIPGRPRGTPSLPFPRQTPGEPCRSPPAPCRPARHAIVNQRRIPHPITPPCLPCVVPANPSHALPFTIFHISTAHSSQPVVTLPQLMDILTFLNFLTLCNTKISIHPQPQNFAYSQARLCATQPPPPTTPCVQPKSITLASLRRSTMPSEAQMAKFMYYIVKQLDVRSVSLCCPSLLPHRSKTKIHRH
jgi:hypothetical protein